MFNEPISTIYHADGKSKIQLNEIIIFLNDIFNRTQLLLFIFYVGGTSKSAPGLFLVLCSEILPGGLGDTYGIPGIKAWLSHIKAKPYPLYYSSDPTQLLLLINIFVKWGIHMWYCSATFGGENIKRRYILQINFLTN